MKKLIIGIGTGRCGTNTLSHLLGKQKNCMVEHESKPILPWEFSKNKIDNKLKSLKNCNAETVGDIAMYYLPYIKYILSNYKNVKVIALKRDKNEVVRSFLQKTEGTNHWMEHDGKKWKFAEFDRSFPKFKAETKEEAIRLYWDHYYKEVEKLLKEFPSKIKLYNMEESFNTKQGVESILNFAEIPGKNRIVVQELKKNYTKKGLRKIIASIARKIKGLN